MIAIPEKQGWLYTIGQLPKILQEALYRFGTLEKAGSGNNPVIMNWSKQLGLQKVYSNDSIPWCGLFIAICVQMAGYTPVADPLWAANWLKYGVPVDVPMLGDIAVFSRNGGNHVAIIIAEDDGGYLVFGGNQADQVCFTWIAKNRLRGAVRSPYKILPPSVKRYFVTRDGKLSTNEQ